MAFLIGIRKVSSGSFLRPRGWSRVCFSGSPCYSWPKSSPVDGQAFSADASTQFSVSIRFASFEQHTSSHCHFLVMNPLHVTVMLMKLYFSSFNNMKILPYSFPIPFALGDRHVRPSIKFWSSCLYFCSRITAVSNILFLSMSQRLFSIFSSTIGDGKSTETTLNQRERERGEREGRRYRLTWLNSPRGRVSFRHG